jgi:hypothetical protein
MKGSLVWFWGLGVFMDWNRALDRGSGVVAYWILIGNGQKKSGVYIDIYLHETRIYVR